MLSFCVGVQKEERSNVSMLAELTHNLENLGQQIARYLRRKNLDSYCEAKDNIGTVLLRKGAREGGTGQGRESREKEG